MAQGTFKRAGMAALVAGLLVGLLVAPGSAGKVKGRDCETIGKYVKEAEGRKKKLIAKLRGLSVVLYATDFLIRGKREELHWTGCWRAENRKKEDCEQLYKDIEKAKETYKEAQKTAKATSRSLAKEANGLKVLIAAYEKQCGKSPRQTTAGTDDGKKAGAAAAGTTSAGAQPAAPAAGTPGTHDSKKVGAPPKGATSATGRTAVPPISTAGRGGAPTGGDPTGTQVGSQKTPPGTQVSSGARSPKKPCAGGGYAGWGLAAILCTIDETAAQPGHPPPSTKKDPSHP